LSGWEDEIVVSEKDWTLFLLCSKKKSPYIMPVENPIISDTATGYSAILS